MISGYWPPLLNHVWQSTVFAIAAGFLTLALRKSTAKARYWLWLAASVKFLIPFYLLVSIGAHVEWRTVRGNASPEWPFAVEQISRPFLAPIASIPDHSVALAAAASPIPALLFLAWACGFIAVLISCWLRWRRIHFVKRAATPLDLPIRIKVLSSPALLEPAVFGIFRPVLLLPDGITRRLTPAQLQAILAHELCHIRRRDNATSALHMLVEAIFWFHPLVWWIGAKLIDEREHACDEAVVQAGNEPQDYAEAILEVCKLYLESPLVCAAGVSGANLKRRIERIMTARIGHKLSRGVKLLLVTTSIATVATPILAGLVNAPVRQTQSPKGEQVPQSIGAATIKPSAGAGRTTVTQSPRELIIEKATLRNLIGMAYSVRYFQISGGPGWDEFRPLRHRCKVRGQPNLGI